MAVLAKQSRSSVSSQAERSIERIMAQLGRPDFVNQAACRGLDPEIFYPYSQKRLNPKLQRKTDWDPQVAERHEPAFQVCRGCPVRLECLRWAMENKQDQGIWGGVPETRRTEAVRSGKSPEELLKEWP